MRNFVSVCLLSVVVFFVSGVNGQSSKESSLGLSMERKQAITICHSTGSKENPYETLVVSDNGEAHKGHPADLIPEPAGGCPGPGGGDGGPVPTPEPLTMLLFGAGVAGVGYAARKLKKRD
jgi:hypothetical protein